MERLELTEDEYNYLLIEKKKEIEKGEIKLIKTNGKFYQDNIVCAGMPKGCYKFVNWSNFKEGTKYAGKLQNIRVKNGVVLKETEFTIKTLQKSKVDKVS